MKINPDFHVTSSGNVKTSNGGYLHGGGQLILKANFQDENPTAKSHKITSNFKGENEQKIYSTIKNVGFSELVVSNNSKVEIKTNLKLDEGLNLQGGILQVNANYVLDYKSTNPVLNYSSNNFIEGAVKKEIQVGESFFFPLGYQQNGLSFLPLEISGLQNDNEFTVELHPIEQNVSNLLSTDIKILSTTEYREVQPTDPIVGPDESYTAKFHWESPTAQTVNLNSLAISGFKNSQWEMLSSDNTNNHPQTGFYELSNLTSNNYFALALTPYSNQPVNDSKNYFLLNEELFGDYAFTEQKELNFLFNEPYSIPKNLDYKVYDNLNAVAIDGAQNTISINPGFNKISLDVSGLKPNIIYTLEVQVTPNEKKHLKFKL